MKTKGRYALIKMESPAISNAAQMMWDWKSPLELLALVILAGGIFTEGYRKS